MIMYGVHVHRYMVVYMYIAYHSVNVHRTCTSYTCVVSNMLKTTCMCAVQATASMYVIPDGVRRTCIIV